MYEPIYMYTCMSLYICVHVHTYMCMYLCVFACTSLCARQNLLPMITSPDTHITVCDV